MGIPTPDRTSARWRKYTRRLGFSLELGVHRTKDFNDGVGMLVAFSVSPSGDGRADGSVHDAVAAAVKVVRDSGLPNRTTSMFTEIEGPDWDTVMGVIKAATE